MQSEVFTINDRATKKSTRSKMSMRNWRHCDEFSSLGSFSQHAESGRGIEGASIGFESSSDPYSVTEMIGCFSYFPRISYASPSKFKLELPIGPAVNGELFVTKLDRVIYLLLSATICPSPADNDC